MENNSLTKMGLRHLESEGLPRVRTSVTSDKTCKTLKQLAEEIKIICRVCKIFRELLKGFTQLQIIETAGRVKNEISVEQENKQRKMIFDHTLFKTRQDHFPKRAKLITFKKPEWRTEEEIKYLRNLLQILPSYQQYSNHLQMLLALVLRFERLGHRRVIVKKGHIGDSFYFIYSGCVAICNDEDGSSAFLDLDPVLLRTGAKFGDIALLKGQRRNATVVCMVDTEILVVDKEDFFANKLDVELQKEFQNRFEYFRSLDIFSHWPPEHIENISESCQTRQFHYDQLVKQDTRQSNSIAFITEGTCELLRLVNLTKCPSYHEWLHVSLPLLNASPALMYERPKSQRPPADKNVLAQKVTCLKEAAVCCCSEKISSHRDSAYEGLSSSVAAAVYIQIDLLHQREFMGLEEMLLQDSQRDERSLVLVSKGCKIILLENMKFNEFCDPKTIEKLQKYQKSYPSDDFLCQYFLQQNDWKLFKKDLVNLLLKPLTNNRPEKKKTKKHTQDLARFSRAGILDLCSASSNNQTNGSVTPRSIYVSTQERDYVTPHNSNVRLIHAITIPRPRLEGLI